MLRERISALRRMHLAIDIVLTCIAFFAATALEAWYHFGLPISIDAESVSPEIIVILCLVWGILIHQNKKSYEYRTKPLGDMLREVARVVLLGTLSLVGLLLLTRNLMHDRSFFILFGIIDFVLLFGLRALTMRILHQLRKRGHNLQNILVVGTGDVARQAVDDLKDHPEWGCYVMGLIDWEETTILWRYRDIPLIGSLSELPRIIQNSQVDWVLFAVDQKHLDKVDESFSICEEMGASACLIADFFSTNIARKEITEFAGRPAIVYSTTPDGKVELFLKGLADRIGAAIGLIIVSPILVAAAALIKLTSRGPVFFKQIRCGLNGRRFEVLKLRTMVTNAENLKEELRSRNEMDGPAFKMKDDPRITRIGKFLRRTSIDELPQLINVARGEMSLVGPRPPIPSEVSQYDRWQRRKLSMKPGLTCLWQVGGRNDTTFDEWMKLDLQYIDNWSIWLDAKILVKTIPAVISATGK